ncbi:PRA1 family protein H-like [Senna tora]|uniref:PRA1 family protein n=1 Tax=Senna tora TaxID=362788 RepID=A0A835CAS6_9FABA|nr:PRA1 family protein H-like [Senna tora]
MVFSSNPLALSVPEPAFESWLRDSGYLEVLDHRTSAAASTSSATSGFFLSFFSRLLTFFSLFTLNPFAKLTAEDFAGDTPSWSHSFIGFSDSYSFPSSPSQARLRVHENIKRYARNYAYLFILFFACTLYGFLLWSICFIMYQMPVPLFGLLSCLALWEVFKFCSDCWRLNEYPMTRLCLVRFAQCVTAVMLIFFNVQMALFCAISVSYAGMIMHAAFRKLTPVKQPSRARVR